MARDYERRAPTSAAAVLRRWWAALALVVAAAVLAAVGALLPTQSGTAAVKVGATTALGYTPTAQRSFLPSAAGQLQGPLVSVPFVGCDQVAGTANVAGAVAVGRAVANCSYADLVNAILVWPVDDAAAGQNATSPGPPHGVVFELATGNALGDGFSALALAVVFVSAEDALWLAAQDGAAASLYLPFVPVLDPSAFALVALAVVTLLLSGAWRSAAVRADLAEVADELGGADPRRPTRPVTVTVIFAISFIVSAAGLLLLLFYFPSVVVYVTIGFFALLSFVSGLQCFAAVLRFSRLRRLGCLLLMLHKYRLKMARPAVDVSAVHLGFAAGWAAVVVWWGLERNASYAWVLQDILGMVLMVALLQSVVLNSVRSATVLLLLAFCYDIVFVFGTDIMESVAIGTGSGEQVPLLLRMPHWVGEVPSYGALGYGDIVLPGMLVLFTREFDLRRGHRIGAVADRLGYYAWALMAYCGGLLATFVALCATQSAQPALLYLVPSTLGVTVLVAWRRGELAKLWNGDIVTDDDLVSEQQRLGSLLAAQDDDFFEGSDQEDDML